MEMHREKCLFCFLDVQVKNVRFLSIFQYCSTQLYIYYSCVTISFESYNVSI